MGWPRSYYEERASSICKRWMPSESRLYVVAAHDRSVETLGPRPNIRNFLAYHIIENISVFVNSTRTNEIETQKVQTYTMTTNHKLVYLATITHTVLAATSNIFSCRIISSYNPAHMAQEKNSYFQENWKNQYWSSLQARFSTQKLVSIWYDFRLETSYASHSTVTHRSFVTHL